MPSKDNLQYQKDLEFGHKEEIRIKSILEEYFGELNVLDKYNPFDYENDEYLIELKSRRIPHNKYDTAMVNYSKLLRTSNTQKKRVIIFNYSDGLFYWYVNSDDYNIGKGGRNDRGVEEVYIMAYVKKESLENLNNHPQRSEQ
tara:strand:+ start:485 stop:913 length:429 start_codon:yes stop_codon:yes gene_type:complete